MSRFRVPFPSPVFVILLVSQVLVACVHSSVKPGDPDAIEGQSRAGRVSPESEGISRIAASWYGNAVMYEIMVRSFADSNGDGIGDLRGLIDRLDYLNTGDPRTTTDLKVDAIWLMPIFESPSYHGYDTTNYLKIDPAYGTMEDFHELVDQAHARGIRILLDLVLNHTSNQHPWFQRSAHEPEGEYGRWYVWRADGPAWTRPWGGGPVWHKWGSRYYYGLFWEGMPDLNYDHPAVGEEMMRIGAHWLREGADGYRLDAIRYLYENGKGKQADQPRTHAWLKRFSARMHEEKEDAVLIGEVWSKAEDIVAYHGRGDELDLAFGFPESAGILESIQTASARPLADALLTVKKLYPEPRFSAPFLTNHDMPRLATLLDRDPARIRLAAVTLLSLPGTPFVYQGEEIGLFNGSRPGDEGKRTPMQWTSGPQAGFTNAPTPWNTLSGEQDTISVAAQQGRPDSLLTWYQTLIRLRKASPALRRGGLFDIQYDADEPARLGFVRVAEGELMLADFNFSSAPVPSQERVIPPDVLRSARLAPGGLSARALLLGTDIPMSVGDRGEVRLTLPRAEPFSARWIRIR